MKLYKLIVTVSIVSGFFAGTGCTKNFEELNTDPTLITKDLIKPDLLLSAVQKNSVFNVLNSHSTIMEFAGYYKNPASGDIFQVRDYGDPFNSFYRSYLINIAEIMRLTADDPTLVHKNAIARIWRAWLYYQLTDVYGDIPYTEAVNDVDEMVVQPKYDTQEFIYTDLLKELKEAAEKLTPDATQISYGNADLILKGDVDRWRRFANSLRLRLAMRVRYANSALAQQHITEVLGQPLIETNTQNVKLATVSDGNTANSNQFYQRSLTQPGNMVASFTLTDNLKKLNDPRLPVLARSSPIPGAEYRGVPTQIGTLQKARYGNDSSALMSLSFLQPVLDLIIVNAAEVKLLRAEAALANLSNENEQDLFAQGIRLAMEQYSVAAPAISTYLASPAATLTGTEEQKLEQIIVQKWIAIYYNATEGWAEFRRTGYPRIWTGSDLGDTQGNIPRRFTYPNDEYFRNAANVTEAAGRITGGDKLMGRVWWDKKPGLPFLHPRQGMFPPEE